MNKDLEYYLNHSQCNCVTPKLEDYLTRKNYLSEFLYDEEKEIARFNLGVTAKLDELKDLLDAKVIESGSVAWDLIPTEGHTSHALSSDALYKEFAKYATLKHVNDVWTRLLELVLNYLNETTEDINLFKELVISKVNALESRIDETQKILLDKLNCLIAENMEIYNTRLDHIEADIRDLKHLVKSANSYGVSNRFGDNENISVSQKALTDAISTIYKTFADYTGKPDDMVHIAIIPKFIIADENQEVEIIVKAYDNEFESIKVFLDNELIIDEENIRNYELSLTLEKNSTIRVEAYFLGRQYIEEKTIEKHYPFFIGSGKTVDDVINENNIMPFNGSFEGSYNINVHKNGDKIFIVVPQQNTIGSIYMNGFAMPTDLNIIDNKLTVYASKNTYGQGNTVILIQNT